MNSQFNNNTSSYDSLPTITISNKYGTKTYQPTNYKKYKMYLDEQDENHRKTGQAIGILIYFGIGCIGIALYSFYSFFVKK